MGSSPTCARTHVSCIGREILNHCTTREALFIYLFDKYFLSASHVPGTVHMTGNMQINMLQDWFSRSSPSSRMNSSMTYAMIEVRTKFFGNIVEEKLSMFWVQEIQEKFIKARRFKPEFMPCRISRSSPCGHGVKGIPGSGKNLRKDTKKGCMHVCKYENDEYSGMTEV